MSIADFLALDIRRWPTASCRGMDPDLFFPSSSGEVKAAKAVCAACPVRAECLEYALANAERLGVWGGTSERERGRLRRSQRAKVTS